MSQNGLERQASATDIPDANVISLGDRREAGAPAAAGGPLPGTGEAENLLTVKDLSIEFATSGGLLRAVDRINLTVKRGETHAIVGESGSGKSVTALSLMRLLPRIARYASGSVFFNGEDLLSASPGRMREIRGRDIAMIFQEPMTSLNPLMTIGFQIMEPLKIHLDMSDAQAQARAEELLGLVGISDAKRRLNQYPHQFSGGMRQRVMIAIGLACNPKLIIADEPTTALDVTIQAQILELMKDLSRRLDIALIIITHNLGVVARYADRISVMYAAQVVEQGEAGTVFHEPRHPYTLGLLRSVPRLDQPRLGKLATIEGLPPSLAQTPKGCRFAPRCPYRIAICETEPPLFHTDVASRSACFRVKDIEEGRIGREPPPADAIAKAALTSEPILSVRGLTKHFEISGGFQGGGGKVRAVEDVNLDIQRGETLGLVGESGCGKSTLGRLILRLENPTSGEMRFEGADLGNATHKELIPFRRKIQVIFQDPFSSLNPRMTVERILMEPLSVYNLRPTKQARRDRVAELLSQVGLRPEMAQRYPHQLSGGQRQRVGIARALAMEPSFIVCDEAVSALDVSIQGQIINLLERLQAELDLTFLFIAHDLAVVRHISSRVVVMYLGRVMEIADRDEIYARPLHPYTKLLLDAAPVPDPTVEKAREPRLIQGDIPSALNPPEGCVFHTRCPIASEECKQVIPPVEEKRPGHFVACIKVERALQ